MRLGVIGEALSKIWLCLMKVEDMNNTENSLELGGMTSIILEKIGNVARGEIDVRDLAGSTTERLAIGLALNQLSKTNPCFAGDEMGAWVMLDASQKTIVQAVNVEYQNSKWGK